MGGGVDADATGSMKCILHRTLWLHAVVMLRIVGAGSPPQCPADGTNATHMNVAWSAANDASVVVHGPRLPAIETRTSRSYGVVGSCVGTALQGFDGGEIVVAATTGPDTSAYSRVLRFSIEVFLDWINLERPLMINGTHTTGGLVVDGRRYSVRFAWVADQGAADAAAALAHGIRRENTRLSWAGYGSTVSRLQAEQAQLDGAFIMASSAADPAVFRGRNLAFGALPRADCYLENAVRAIAQAALRQAHNFTDASLRVGLVFTPPLDQMCAPIGQLALDLNMSVSGFDPTIGVTSAQVWASNSLPRQPTEAEVDLVLRALQEDGVNVVIGCTYVESGLATIDGLERVDYSPLATAFTSTVDISTYRRRVVDRGWWQGDYHLGVSPWHESLNTRGDFSRMNSAEFLDRYYARSGERPSYHGPASFSAACALVAAIEAADSVDAMAVANALRATKLREFGFATPMDFEGLGSQHEGQNNPEMLVLQYAPGSTQLGIVYPSAWAVSSVQFPTPRWGKRRCVALGPEVLYSPYDEDTSQLLVEAECSGNGVCEFARIQDGHEVFSCVCNAGWAGSNCEEENEIVIGALYKTNNDWERLGTIGESIELQAVHTAVHRVNAAAGFFATPTNLRLVVVDLSPMRAAAPESASRFNAAQHAAQRLSEAGAVAAVGSPYSSDSMSLAAPLHERGIPLVSHSSTNPDLSNKAEYPGFVRLCPSDSLQGVALADAIDYFGWRTVVVWHCDDAYCQGLKDVLVNRLNEPGRTRINIEEIPVTEVDGDRLTQATLDTTVQRLTNDHSHLCGTSDTVIVVLVHASAAFQLLEHEGVSALPVAWLASESVGNNIERVPASFSGGLLAFSIAIERLPPTHQDASLLPANASSYDLIAFDAVTALAEAFAYIQRSGSQGITMEHVLAALETISFRGQSGHVDLKDGDRLLGYVLHRYHRTSLGTVEYPQVGDWSQNAVGKGKFRSERSGLTAESLAPVQECLDDYDWFSVVIVLVAVFVGVVAIVLMANKRKEMMAKKREEQKEMMAKKREEEKLLLQDDGGLYYQCDRIIYSSESILVVELDRVEWSLAATAYTRVADIGSEDRLALTFLRDERRYRRKLGAQKAIDNSVAAVDIPPPGEKHSGNVARNDENREKLPSVVGSIMYGDKNWYDNRVIVMSCPEWGTLNPDDSQGPYEEPVMETINELRQQGRLHAGFDRAGSSNMDPRDAATWPKVFKTEGQEHLFEADEEERKGLIKSTIWFAGYRTAAKAQMNLECQAFHGTLEVICIKGGPITDVEHEEMDRIIEEAKRDAAANKIQSNIQLRKVSYYEFLHDYANTARSTDSRCPFACAFSTKMARHTLQRELELKRWVPGGDKALVQYYLRRTAERLHSMHEAGWTHGDVSLENVLVFAQSSSKAASQADGALTRTELELKLSGLSRATDHRATSGTDTGSGGDNVEGTEELMSDDVSKGAETEQACKNKDIWSFGVVALQMCTKGLDLSKDRPDWNNILFEPAKRVEWPEAEELVLWCLCKDLLPRPQSFEEVLGHPFLRADDDDCTVDTSKYHSLGDEIKRRKLENAQRKAMSKMAIAEGVCLREPPALPPTRKRSCLREPPALPPTRKRSRVLDL